MPRRGKKRRKREKMDVVIQGKKENDGTAEKQGGQRCLPGGLWPNN